MAARAQTLAVVVLQLGRERAFAHPGGIGLDDAQRIIDRIRPETNARRRLPRDHVRGGDKGIGAEIDVQKRALRALKQDALARLAQLVQDFPDRLGILQDLGGDGAQIGQNRRAVDRAKAQPGAQRVVVHKRAVDAQLQRLVIGQIRHADDATADLVLVAGPDAAAGGADLGNRGLRLAGPVQLAVERHDEGGVFRDHQVVGIDLDALFADRRHFLDQMPGVQHDAVADHRKLAAAHDARGQRVQLVDLAANDERVAGIVAALKAGDHVGPFTEPVDDLALAFVAPLGADNHHVGHSHSPQV